MRTLVTGHRLHKLEAYDIQWIRESITASLLDGALSTGFGLSGMASGVDLWFCQSCLALGIPYAACIPFESQSDTMDSEQALLRDVLIAQSSDIRRVRNSSMVEHADNGIVVWDGNKGGTHNVAQQMVEADKPFIWLNPVGRKIWICF